ncbi:hypothetical protein [Vibrio alginolyticus]|uniref:hypothetical protein n=1 Tax=Vibrio alginolyticus TaxID=663 RepID=UPI000B04005F|nr:hypothetical protein [Vibrio alginolyticus]CAH7171054.1 hypothetical protein VCHA51O444_10424 [Vibrio chagasii]
MDKWFIVVVGIPFFLLVALWLFWVFPYMFQMLRSGLGDEKHIAKLDKAFGFEELRVTDSLSFGRGSRFISYTMRYPKLKSKQRLAARKDHITMLMNSAFAYSSAVLLVIGLLFKIFK